jgi:ABC-2 type transport system permease protein
MALLIMALVATMFTALGTAIASVLTDFQGFQLIVNFLVMPIFFLSGALFPLAKVPRAIAIIAHIDPLSYGVDGLRHALLGAGYFSLPLDFTILTVISVGLVSIGAYLFSRIQL